jgi:hypothetical protein
VDQQASLAEQASIALVAAGEDHSLHFVEVGLPLSMVTLLNYFPYYNIINF